MATDVYLQVYDFIIQGEGRGKVAVDKNIKSV